MEGAQKNLLEEPVHDDLEWPSFDEEEGDDEARSPPEGGAVEDLHPEEDNGDDGEDSWGDEEDDEEEEEEEDVLLYGKEYHSLFNPNAYITALYPDPNLDSTGSKSKGYNEVLMQWLHTNFFSGKRTGKCLLDVCSGPTITSIISASKFFRCIYLTEYSNGNRKCLRDWANHEDGAVSWKPYFSYVAQLEGETSPNIEDRVRRSIRDIASCNLSKAQSFGILDQVLPVDCVTSCLTLEAVASDDNSYIKLLRKLSRCLRRGGHLLLTGVLQQESFSIGDQRFFCHPLKKDFVKEAVESVGFQNVEIEVHSIKGANEGDVIVGDFFLLSAVKGID